MKKTLYIKRFSVRDVIGVSLILSFSVFNLYWISETYARLGMEQTLIYGISLPSFLGILVIYYVVSGFFKWQEKIPTPEPVAPEPKYKPLPHNVDAVPEVGEFERKPGVMRISDL